MKLLKICLLTFLPILTFGQSTQTTIDKKPFVLGYIDEIDSKELSEKRILNIYVPEGYGLDTPWL